MIYYTLSVIANNIVIDTAIRAELSGVVTNNKIMIPDIVNRVDTTSP